MGLIRERDQDDEQQPDGSSPWVDLGLRTCPVCRRELMAWEERCPDDGAEGVRQGQIQADGIPPIPAHLLDEPDGPDANEADRTPQPPA